LSEAKSGASFAGQARISLALNSACARCSMKITTDVREYASGLFDNEKATLYTDAAKQGMADMSKKFIDMGAEVYVDQAAVVKESNKAS
jgi:hypothetical protein